MTNLLILALAVIDIVLVSTVWDLERRVKAQVDEILERRLRELIHHDRVCRTSCLDDNRD
jgi:hypothetical protein